MNKYESKINNKYKGRRLDFYCVCGGTSQHDQQSHKGRILMGVRFGAGGV